MTELLTAAQMRAIEQAAIESGQVTGLELMERAGTGVVEAIFEEWSELKAAPHRAVVLCGPGNNGGDGFVVARLLKEWGWDVDVLASETSERTPADAAENRKRWGALGAVHPLNRDGLRATQDADIYVDSVFGTGLSRPATGDLAELLAYLAGSGGDYRFFQPRMVAVDVPSGLCADSGKVLGCPEPDPFASLAPYARLTVTFETPKPGHSLGHGPDLCGKVVVKDIGLEGWRSRSPDGFGLRLQRLCLVPSLVNGPDEPRPLFRIQPRSKRQGHKYDHGHVVVVTGGMGATGAARLAARGALRAGAGLVTLAAPGAAMMEVACQTTALMLKRVDDGSALEAHLQDARMDVVVLGPGLGVDDRGAELLETALRLAPPPAKRTYLGQGRCLVLDADALTLLAQRAEPFAGLGKNTVLTPHAGEFRRLFPDIAKRLACPEKPLRVFQYDISPEGIAAMHAEAKAYRKALEEQAGPAFSKVDAVREAAVRCGAVVLLKGADTVVALPDGRAWVHSSAYDRAAPWLATAGAGDVLAGFIAGLLARKHRPHEAAILGAWLHVECARAFGPGLIAEDLPEMLPQVFRDLGL